jgi:hypothetical protein
LVTTDSTNLEANRENSEAIVVHQEVPNEETAVQAGGAQEDQSEDQGDYARGVPSGPMFEKR